MEKHNVRSGAGLGICMVLGIIVGAIFGNVSMGLVMGIVFGVVIAGAARRKPPEG